MNIPLAATRRNAGTELHAWLRFGSFLSAHTVWFILGAVAIGILLPQVLSPLRPYVPVMFAFTIFQGSLGITFHALRETARHPLPLVVVLAFAHVIAPTVAYLLGTLCFGYDPNIVTGIVLEYSVPVAATMIMWVGLYNGNVWAALTTLLVSTLIAPVTIPATLQLFFGTSVQIDGAGMMQSMLLTIALPSLLGLFFNEGSRGWASRKLSGVLQPATRMLIPLIVGSNSTAISAYVLHLTPELFGVLLFILCFALGCFFAGIGIAKLLRQPDDTFVTIMFGCGMRNITAGAVIATQYFPAETIFPVMAGTLFQQILASLFGPMASRFIGKGGQSAQDADTSKAQQPAARQNGLPDSSGASPAPATEGDADED